MSNERKEANERTKHKRRRYLDDREVASLRHEAPASVLCVDTGLDGVALKLRIHVRLRREGNSEAGGGEELPLDEVDASDHLGDGVLHLQPRVHLAEVKVVSRDVQHELDWIVFK